MVEQARALKKATNKPVKVQYTGIQVFAQATNDLYYKSSHDRAMDIAKAINEDILEVDSLGVDFIQLDEFTWPYGFEDWAIEAFDRAVEGVKNAKIICHICWGNWGGTPAYMPDQTAQAGEIFDLTQRKGPTPGDSTFVIPTAYQAKMDVLNLESCGRRSDDLHRCEHLRRDRGVPLQAWPHLRPRCAPLRRRRQQRRREPLPLSDLLVCAARRRSHRLPRVRRLHRQQQRRNA